MSALFGGGAKAPSLPPPPDPRGTDEDVIAAQRQERRRIARARGSRSTLLAGRTELKTLLGGGSGGARGAKSV